MSRPPDGGRPATGDRAVDARAARRSAAPPAAAASRTGAALAVGAVLVAAAGARRRRRRWSGPPARRQADDPRSRDRARRRRARPAAGRRGGADRHRRPTPRTRSDRIGPDTTLVVANADRLTADAGPRAARRRRRPGSSCSAPRLPGPDQRSAYAPAGSPPDAGTLDRRLCGTAPRAAPARWSIRRRPGVLPPRPGRPTSPATRGDAGYGYLGVPTDAGPTGAAARRRHRPTTSLGEEGNAALAMNVLGSQPRIVWLMAQDETDVRRDRRPDPTPAAAVVADRRGPGRSSALVVVGDLARPSARPDPHRAAAGQGPRLRDRRGPRPALLPAAGPRPGGRRAAGRRPAAARPRASDTPTTRAP